ncbi:MAG: metalloenzyme [Leptospiraceae bacterium]|nr:metalloenzyme [Leptospiraceae bacterium]MCP5500243.1 metalloenzyme [Leptospiraceae bacterium]
MISFVFIDGIGYGKDDSEKNPFSRFATDFFLPLTERKFPQGSIFSKGEMLVTDAGMGIEGLPQSATGQTAMWTGINTARVMKRHISGYPTFTLKKIIAEYSILKILNEQGMKAEFLNCYSPVYIEHIKKSQRHLSASTFIQLASGKPFKNLDDLRQNRGIYMDITHRILKQIAGKNLPKNDPLLEEKDPYERGALLAEIMQDYDFSIYEFFLTDKAGHAQDWEFAEEVILCLEGFMRGLIENFPKEGQLILTSDHGNLEDLSEGKHTRNSVPTYLYGKHTEFFKTRIKSLYDIPLAIYELLNINVNPYWDVIED